MVVICRMFDSTCTVTLSYQSTIPRGPKAALTPSDSALTRPTRAGTWQVKEQNYKLGR